MTCYSHHLRDVFDALGLEYDKPGRERLDSAIREVLGLSEQAHCPEVWAAAKATPRPELVARLTEVLAE